MPITYKEYQIEAFETERGRWRARIRRTDSRKIKVAVPEGAEHDFIDTGGQESFAADAAIDVAKRLIDRGAMS
jgi:hypothetical protein